MLTAAPIEPRTQLVPDHPSPAGLEAGTELDGLALLSLVDRDVELLSAVAEAFVECWLEQIDWLDHAVRANDRGDAHHAAHQLRGSLISVGARQAASVTLELERAARADRLGGREGQLAELRERLERIAAELVELVATSSAAAGAGHLRVPA